MGKKGRFLSLHILMSFLHFLLISKVTKSSGFSIKIIHRDSPESPFYQEGMTPSARILHNIRAAKAYASRLSNSISLSLSRNNSGPFMSSMLIRPRIDKQGLQYVVEVGIGMFSDAKTSNYKYFLHMDTGNEFTWTQCEDCRRFGWNYCFQQAPPLYPASRSRTYRPLLCGRHPLCSPGMCLKNICTYDIEYGDGAKTYGYLASESFSFSSTKNKTETIKNIVFGCGLKNRGFKESSKTNLVVGNFGLGQGNISFLSQTKSLTKGRFSYCLPPWESEHNTTVYLHFGDDIPHRQGLKVTPLLPNKKDMFGHYIILTGISVGNRKLGIPPGFFALRNNGYGGCTVDSGSSITVMPPLAYQKLEEMIKNHLSSYRRTKKLGNLSLCYVSPDHMELKKFPTITFHLQNSDMVFQPERVYVRLKTNADGNVFCLGIIPEPMNGMTIIGAFQQANTRFIFDSVQQKMYFGPEECAVEG